MSTESGRNIAAWFFQSFNMVVIIRFIGECLHPVNTAVVWKRVPIGEARIWQHDSRRVFYMWFLSGVKDGNQRLTSQRRDHQYNH